MKTPFDDLLWSIGLVTLLFIIICIISLLYTYIDEYCIKHREYKHCVHQIDHILNEDTGDEYKVQRIKETMNAYIGDKR